MLFISISIFVALLAFIVSASTFVLVCDLTEQIKELRSDLNNVRSSQFNVSENLKEFRYSVNQELEELEELKEQVEEHIEEDWL